MGDRKALAAALERFTANWHSGDFKLIATAARERLAQMPETCGTCDGLGRTGTKSVGVDTEVWASGPCPTCHGSGKVYPAELVERIANAIYSVPSVGGYQAQAVAVLDTINRAVPG